MARLTASVDVGSSFEQTLNYTCSECTLSDVLCRGESALMWGSLAAIPVTKMLNFNFPRLLRLTPFKIPLVGTEKWEDLAAHQRLLRVGELCTRL